MINPFTGITAALYDEWYGQEPYHDQHFYQYFIENQGGTSLEIGSGTGRLLLPYLKEGLIVEGLEPSQEMIDIWQQKAKKNNLYTVIHKQSMEAFSLSKEFDTIYIPFCSFQLVTDRTLAQKALNNFYAHLKPGGQLLVSLFIPQQEPEMENVWRLRRKIQKDDTKIYLSESISQNNYEQLQTQELKYEHYKYNQLIKTELTTHHYAWYHKYEFQMMLEKASFKNCNPFGDYTHQEAGQHSEVIIWHAKK